MIKVCYLGADRVGKSTKLKRYDQSQVIHFGAPNPSDRYWFSQYEYAEGFTYADRGPAEAGYFRGISLIELANYIHMSPIWNKTHYIVLSKAWGATLEARHKEELYLENPTASPWWIKSMLTKRMREHHDYYKHVLEVLLELELDYSIIEV